MPLLPAAGKGDKHQLTSKLLIKVNGTKLPEEQKRRVLETVVEQSLHLPDMFVIRLHDVGDDNQPDRASYFKMLDQDTFAVGREVEIEMGHQDEPKPVMKGEITSVEVEISQGQGPQLTVRGYARSHRLHRGRHSRSFLNQSDGDIVRKIAQEAGLTAEVDSTPTHDYVFQNNQTNWEFLRERAARLGYELFVDGRTLHFRKPQNGKQQAPEQKLFQGLLSLRVMVSSAFQAGEVVVKAWDPKTKQPIVGRASDGQLAPKTGLPQNGKQMASQFGAAKVYVVNRPVESQAEADAMAKAVYDDLDGAFVQAEGTCLGDPAIKPGTTVKMDNLGKRLSGQYYVTSATHTVDAYGAYTTAFVVSGRQTNSLLELLQAKGDGASAPNVVVGIVTNNTDPDDLGRVKVKFPWLADDESWWARIASPMAGPNRGFYWLPEVDDEVLVSFEHGDVTRPFILGALWNGKDKPPKPNSEVVGSSKVNQRIVKTRAGHVITLDDTSGSEKISIVDKTGKNQIVIESSSNKITIQADGDVNVEAKGKVNVKAQQDVAVETQTNADVKVTGNATVTANGNASLEATGNLSLKGAQVSVEAQATMSIKASGPLTIKGAVVNIN